MKFRLFSLFFLVCLVFQPDNFAQTGTPPEITAEQNLAAELVAAPDENAQNELLTRFPDLQNLKLRQAVSIEANRLRLAGNYAGAIKNFDLARRIAEKINDQPGVSGSYNNIGVVYNDQSNYGAALEFYEKSLTLKRAAKDHKGIAFADNNIGLIYHRLGKYLDALERLNRAARAAQTLGEKDLQASALHNSAIVYSALGNPAQAHSLNERALQLTRETGDKRLTATILSAIGLLYNEQQNYPAALDFHRQSLVLREESTDKSGIASSLNNLGFVFLRQGDFAQSIVFHEKALKIAEETQNLRSAATALVNLAFVRLALNQPETARATAERALVIAKQIGVDELIINAEINRGEAWRRLRNFPAARAALENAVARIETTRANLGGEANSTQFFAQNQRAYFALLELELDENNAAAALNVAERTKARALLDILASGRVALNKSLTIAEQNQETEFNRRISELNRQTSRARSTALPDAEKIKSLDSELQKIRLDYEAFRLNLYAAHPDLRAQRGEAKIIQNTEIAEILRTNSGKTLLEYVVGENASYLFIISPAKNPQSPPDVKVHKINAGKNDLTVRAEKFRAAIANRGAYQTAAREFYELLIAPARTQIAGKKELIIVPDGALWNVPFQALLSPKNDFLLANHAVSFAPSLTALREMRRGAARRQNKLPNKLLAFGNPLVSEKSATNSQLLTVRAEKLAPLPDAETEVLALRELYGSGQSAIFLGANADEASVKREAEKAQILHFATHGILNDTNPLYSHLIFAPDKNGLEDGLLEAREILNLKLTADLIVLSACETARGRISAGEGIIGLSWAFFVAGSPTTVVSQWKVASKSTSQLMIDFHKNRQIGKLSKPEALRQAALRLQTQSAATKHPFYWASFVIIGSFD